jgi:uncharacterized protein (TIGR00290 family)
LSGDKRAAAVAWSSGKDAAWALHVLERDPDLEVRVLLTTFNEAFGRAAMHGVRRCLVQAQATAVGLPLYELALPWPCSNAIYERRMRQAVGEIKERFGVDSLAFGDLFLDDIREYRLRVLADSGVELLFPLWGKSTGPLAVDMIAAGVKAYLTCIDPRVLAPSFAGRAFDYRLLEDLPAGVDACGENGEFHTLVVDGPAFRNAVAVEPGEVVERDGFVFADFLPPVEHETRSA